MKIIISPAKKMNIDCDSLPVLTQPVFMNRAEKLREQLRGMGYEELKKLWKCNDSIAAQNVERLADLELNKNQTPAILAYEGIQYQYMAPGVFTDHELEYIQQHLRILSGLYGVLRPFDGVIPYRLEMQAKLKTEGHKDLYSYWGSCIAEELCRDEELIIDLASKEYSISVSRHLPEGVRLITCVFGEEKDGKIIEKGTMCKMARGEMVRFMAENNVLDVEKLKGFSAQGYRYSEEYSDESKYVFILEKKPKGDEW